MHPAIDLFASGARRDELLLAPAELTVMTEVRRATEQFLNRLRATRSNAEFVARVSATLSVPAAA
ncbi:hypothetical protein [Amycolatopsis methanolica]|uniref:Transcription termination factor Rho n=1 Tax=Amycolatopsis methanolica 239 TaxID=1068978 RepID=A0A076MYB9_AMYME|nr:hypothetical protein [Amycolatopsis methanolica]AIJ23695.1 transcription termination factor Rho [Amycolatopsis methanolica 239]